mmetsp:Transcript_29417/g.94287  ORF Transcript_29417/g.94287 Transcript_29417/m.94287 type:complete len:561 (+) Transcript_29417:92-1774(+)
MCRLAEAAAAAAQAQASVSTSVLVASAQGGASTCRNKPYLEAAPAAFGQPFAHRLRWAHAVNSQWRLDQALAGDADLIEADVAIGPLRCSPEDGSPDGAPCFDEVRTPAGDHIIMAHFPTQRSSDLSLSQLVSAVLRHNDCIAAAEANSSRWEAAERQQRAQEKDEEAKCKPEEVLTDDEAADFASSLDKELEVAAKRPLLPACLGSREGHHIGRSTGSRRKGWRKGIKLDFKQLDCVGPTVAYLRSIRAASKLDGHLWLNADVCNGPGTLVTPLDAQKFVRLCAEEIPEAVLSLGWGATTLTTESQYTHEMIDRMIELCMCPIVKRPLPCRDPSPGAPPHEYAAKGSTMPSSGPQAAAAAAASEADLRRGQELHVAPAAACRHITFAVAVEFALASEPSLRRLLDYMPDASLTIYSGVGSMGVTPATVQDLVRTFGRRRCFFDLKVSWPWRSWLPFGAGGGPQLAEALPSGRPPLGHVICDRKVEGATERTQLVPKLLGAKAASEQTHPETKFVQPAPPASRETAATPVAAWRPWATCAAQTAAAAAERSRTREIIAIV